MKKKALYYQTLDYPITIVRMEDGMYCAEIGLLNGCKGYGETPGEACNELAGVKDTLIELLLKQNKPIPEPTVHLEIPVNEFSRMPNKKKLQQFIRSS